MMNKQEFEAWLAAPLRDGEHYCLDVSMSISGKARKELFRAYKTLLNRTFDDLATAQSVCDQFGVPGVTVTRGAYI